MPFHHINIKNEGKLSACWRYPDWIGDFTKESLIDAWNGERMRQVRLDLTQGIKHEGCKSCWDLERSGARSLRQTAPEMYRYISEQEVAEQMSEDGSYPQELIRSIEIRFDNTCNLMCRHCSPTYSSVWEQMVKKDQDLMDQMVKFGTYRIYENHIRLTQETIDDVVALSPGLRELMITGGEPLYHAKHYDFLERILPEAHHIILQYNSNFSTLEYKGKSILDLWRNFKKVSIRVSIDADPNVYDYVRVRGDLPEAENNIRKALELPNVDISATCTTNLLNITRLCDVAKYFDSLGVRFHTSLVQFPRALNPKLLPKELKQKVTQQWQQLRASNNYSKQTQNRWQKFGDNVVHYMNGEDWYEHWHEFIQYTAAQDKHHNTNILDYYPEYKDYWNV